MGDVDESSIVGHIFSGGDVEDIRKCGILSVAWEIGGCGSKTEFSRVGVTG